MTEKKDSTGLKGLKLQFKRGVITGIVVLLPLTLSIFAIRFFLNSASPIGRYLVIKILENFNIPQASFLPVVYPVMGILFLVIFTWFIGIMASNYAGKKVVQYGEVILARIPLISTIYFAAKQLMEAFTVDESQAFREVVLVEYPRKGLYSVGFITSTSPPRLQNMILGDKKVVNVFVATTPNPTSGVLILVPEEDCIKLNISVEDGIKFIVSAGILVPKPLNDIKNSLGNNSTLNAQ